VVSSDEPASFTEAEHNPSWRKTMMEEMDSVTPRVSNPHDYVNHMFKRP
jgi:hypothetical protein